MYQSLLSSFSAEVHTAVSITRQQQCRSFVRAYIVHETEAPFTLGSAASVTSALNESWSNEPVSRYVENRIYGSK